MMCGCGNPMPLERVCNAQKESESQRLEDVWYMNIRQVDILN